MAIIVSVNTKEYEKPAEGVVTGVLADVADLGIISGFYGDKPKIRLSWVIDQKDSDGNFFVVSKTYTASLHEKSNLYADVKDIMGKVPPVPYNVELLIGHVNTLVLKKETATKGPHAGKDFTNIKAFLAAKTGTVFPVPDGYVREKDGGVYGRPKQTNQGQQQQSRTPAPAQQAAPVVALPPQQEIADEDIPF